jgi:hypothetical protein
MQHLTSRDSYTDQAGYLLPLPERYFFDVGNPQVYHNETRSDHPEVKESHVRPKVDIGVTKASLLLDEKSFTQPLHRSEFLNLDIGSHLYDPLLTPLKEFSSPNNDSIVRLTSLLFSKILKLTAKLLKPFKI